MLILFSLQLISVYLVQSLEQYYLTNYKESFENQARLLAVFMEPGFGERQDWAEDTVRLAREFRDLHDMEIVILDSYAMIVGSSGNQAMIGRRLIREEITRALSGQLSDNMRFDPANEERRYYLAFPVESGRSVMGVIYLSGSLKTVDDTLNEVKTILLTGVGFALAVSFLLGITLTRTITGPIKEVTEQAFSMAGGDFSRKISVHTNDEIGRLGETFNYLAEQLSMTINQISTEKNKVEAIIYNMTDGIVALDEKGKVIHLNPSAKDIVKALGLRSPQLERSGFHILRKLIGPEEVRRFIRQQQPMVVEISGNTPQCTIQLKIAPFKMGQGKLDGTLTVLHDITRERELNRLQEEFVADVSHELRTPLATVKSYVETLLDGAAEEPDTRNRFLNVLSRETDRMVSLVKDLLTLSRMDSNRALWDRSEVDVSEMAQEAVEQLKQKLQVCLPEIRIETEENLSPVFVDRDQILRVFSNLLNNAARYTGTEGLILITAQERNNQVEIIISDTGQGIPANELPRIFERFFRVEKTRSRDFGGTGLGLSIARKIVEGHGGSIEITSVFGQGTTVTFTLPLLESGEEMPE